MLVTVAGIIALFTYGLTKLGIKPFDAFLVVALIISLLFFWGGLSECSKDYTSRIDGLSENYTPFAHEYSLTFFTFLALSIIALIILWLKQRVLPPLLLVVVVSMILIGIALHVIIILQTSEKTDLIFGMVDDDRFLFYLLPFCYITITLVLVVRLVRSEANLSASRNFENPALNRLNNFMAKAQLQPLWALLLVIPLFLFITLILVLFGQDSHGITKVFTETTTWHFSTKSHPPLLNHQGHYLCTVAACGDPKTVKPLGWGQRHGYPILVNRQLQIANAFEELIQENLPGMHRIIRRIYDQYGYPLSKKINTSSASNTTYRLMKPLEYFFLIILYFCCLNPEQKIAEQYLAR